ncbi:GGDEF domain-containing protein [Vibrio alginolyticus]|nr:GGDEF domain-containing protein [Vibrio alginolyticus]
MRVLYPLLASLLLTPAYASDTQDIEPNQNITQWHSVYQTTLRSNPESALSMLQDRYHTAKSDSEKLYVSGLIYEYMSNINQPYYGSSQVLDNRFSQLESEYILALKERKHGSYEASVDSFSSLRQTMKKISDSEGKALMNYQLCYTLNQQGRYHKANFYCSSIESHLNHKHQENFPVDLALRVVANNYNYRGDYEKALSLYRQLMANMSTQSDPSGIYNDIGNLLAELGQFEQSEQYLIQALLVRQDEGTPLEVAQVEHSLGAMYRKSKELDKSISHYKNALTILEQLHYPYGQGLTYLGLSAALADSGQLDTAVDYIGRALNIAQTYENTHLETEGHLAAGLAYLKNHTPEKSIEHGTIALRLAVKNARPLLQAQAQLLLSKAYQAQNDYKKALEHHKAYSTIELTNRDASNIKALEALDLTKKEYEYDLQVAQLNNETLLSQYQFEKLTDQQRTYNFVVFCLLILLALALMVQRQTRLKAKIDSLTCALNRAAIIETIKSHTSKAEGDFRYVLALIDLDDFKAINDQYGHPTGDLVLQQVCKALKAKLNKGEYLGRLGGEEFILLLKNVDEIDVPFRIQSLHKTISEKSVHSLNNHQLNISASLAYLSTSMPLTNFDELYSILDQALYNAKKQGKNSLVDAYNEPISLSAEYIL